MIFLTDYNIVNNSIFHFENFPFNLRDFFLFSAEVPFNRLKTG